MKIIYFRFILPLLIFLSFLNTDTLAYNVTSLNLVGATISGNIMRDGNGLIDNQISGTGIGNTDGIQLVAYLVDANNNIIDKTNVSPGGSYTFNQVANGSFTVAISTNNVAVGLTLATISANLPVGWNAVGESYGIGNSRSGFEMGIPNLQIAAVVTNPNKNILSVNFALDQSPVVSNDFFTTPIDNSLEITVLANDTDPNGNNTINKTTVSLIDPADNVKKSTVTIIGQGVYVVNPISGTVNFDPVPTFMGVTTKIKYTVKDDAGIESNEGVLSVLVKPVGVNDAGRTPIDAPIITIVKANDGNSAIGTIVSIAVPPVNGSVVVNPDGSITYTPIPGDKGIYTYTYLLTTVDGVTSDPITVTVAVGIPVTEITQKGSISLIKTVSNVGSGVNGTFILGNDILYKFTITNTGNLTLNNFVVNDPKLNNPIINIPGTLLPGQTSTFTATYKITAADIALGRVNNQASISSTDVNNNPITDISGTTVNADEITLTQLAKPPIAVDDVVPLKQNQTIIIEILKNDIGVSSNLVPGSVVIKTQTVNGTITVNANGTVTYTPNAGYLGSDIFTYTVTDVNGMTSNVATVTITVGKTMPLAEDDSFKTDLNKSVKVDVISNDIPDGSPFVISTLKIISQPQFGRVTKNSDGSYTYIPNTDFAGKDEFTYNVEDANGNVTNTATVKIEVAGFFVPNVFTPNGDGMNDTFEVIGKENYTAVELEIYNRWGNQVYKNANYQNQWVAEGLNEGTYFYTLKLKSATDSKFVKGWVLVKR